MGNKNKALERTAERQFGGLETSAELGFGGTFQLKSASKEHERTALWVIVIKSH